MQSAIQTLPKIDYNVVVNLLPQKNISRKVKRQITQLSFYTNFIRCMLFEEKPVKPQFYDYSKIPSMGFKLERNENGELFGLTNFLVGKGDFKKAKAAINVSDIANPNIAIRLTTPFVDAKDKKSFNFAKNKKKVLKEITIQNLFRGKKEFVQIFHHLSYPSKRLYEKQSIMVEYCPNGTLDSFLNSTPLSERDEKETITFVKIFKDILTALVEMDEEKVHHRDIKPDNIYLSADMHAKVGDFGLSILVNDEIAKIEGRGKKAPAGTPLFIAPEVILGYKAKILKKGYLNFFQTEIDKIVKKLDAPGNKLADEDVRLLTREMDAYQRNLDLYPEATEMATTTKSDLWSAALCLYLALTGQHFFSDLKNESVEMLFSKMMSLSQEEIDEDCACIKTNNVHAEKLHAFLREILILDHKKRPDAKQAHARFIELFSDT